MDHTINVGTDLNGRKLITNIPDTTEITALKYIAKVNSNNYIAENKMTVEGQTGECSVGYYHYLNGETEETAIFYIRNSTGVVTNLTNFTLPDDFGVVTEIDSTAVLYDYIKRNCHEKVYVICEDFCKEESMTKSEIKDNVNEQVRGYGVPVDSVMGFTGTAAEIPAGFEQCDYINGIVESGSNDNGNWIKYADGTMICISVKLFENVSVTNTWGNLYETPELSLGDFPQSFISTPTGINCSMITNANTNGKGSAGFIEYIVQTTATSWGKTAITKPVSSSASNIGLSLMAIGKWK